jgi:hypothetical protein
MKNFSAVTPALATHPSVRAPIEENDLASDPSGPGAFSYRGVSMG